MEMIRLSSRNAAQRLLRSPALRQHPGVQLSRLQTQPTFRTRPNTTIQARSIHSQLAKRPLSSRFIQRSNARSTRRWKSDDAVLDSKPDSELTLSQRLKKLSREYGWTAVYVYFGLSALDFPFCFLAVKWLGTDVIGHWEHVIVSNIKGLLQWPLGGDLQEQVGDAVDKVAQATNVQEGQRILDEGGEQYIVEDHGYKEAEQANRGSDATLWTQLALAYAIHKSFIFIRIPLTAAMLPKIVKTLRGWGWNIGRPTRKALQSSRSGGKTGVNTKGTGVKPDD